MQLALSVESASLWFTNFYFQRKLINNTPRVVLNPGAALELLLESWDRKCPWAQFKVTTSTPASAAIWSAAQRRAVDIWSTLQQISFISNSKPMWRKHEAAQFYIRKNGFLQSSGCISIPAHFMLHFFALNKIQIKYMHNSTGKDSNLPEVFGLPGSHSGCQFVRRVTQAARLI